MLNIKKLWEQWQARIAERYMQHPHFGYYIARLTDIPNESSAGNLGDGEIQLTQELFVGAGGHRQCYRHPHDQRLCIKVTVSRDKRQSVRELTYYKILARRHIGWDMLPRYYGDVKTNLGVGSVYDYIADYDGSPSRTLHARLSDASWLSEHWQDLRAALSELREYLLRYGIVTMNLHPENILCQVRSKGAVRLYIVDNLGTADFIPLAKYSCFFGRLKMKRKWRRFRELVRRLWPGNFLIHKVFDDSSDEAG